MRQQGAAGVQMRFRIPTFLPSCSRTIFIGSSRSESFDTTTATSKRPMWASCMRCVARSTSEPFSSVLITRTYLALARRHGERHRHLVAQEMAEMDRDARQSAQRSQIKLLTRRLVRSFGRALTSAVKYLISATVFFGSRSSQSLRTLTHR